MRLNKPFSTQNLISKADFEIDEELKALGQKQTKPIPSLLKALEPTSAPAKRKRRYIPPKRLQVTEGTIYELPLAQLCELLEEGHGMEYVADPTYDLIRKLYVRYPNRRYYAFRPLPGSPIDSPAAGDRTAYWAAYEAVMELLRGQQAVHGAPYYYTPEKPGDDGKHYEWLIVMMTEFCTHSKYTVEEIASWELFPTK